jgi:hypothetical protein
MFASHTMSLSARLSAICAVEGTRTDRTTSRGGGRDNRPTLRDVVTQKDRENAIPDEELSVARSQGSAADVRWHLKKDGSQVFIEGVVHPLWDDRATLTGHLKIGQDFTTRCQTEKWSPRARNVSAPLWKEIRNSSGAACPQESGNGLAPGGASKRVYPTKRGAVSVGSKPSTSPSKIAADLTALGIRTRRYVLIQSLHPEK